MNSEISTIECEIPQGSILGHLIFIIYPNDLYDTLNCVKSNLFADDSALYYSSPTIPHLHKTMNRELDNLDWFQANKLSLNVSKTNDMIFLNTNSQQITMEIKLTNKIITKINHVKFLGVFTDENLK